MRLLVDTLRKRFGIRLFDAIGGGGAITLLTDGKEVYARTESGQFFNLLRAPGQPLLVVGNEGTAERTEAAHAVEAPPAKKIANRARRRNDADVLCSVMASTSFISHGRNDSPQYPVYGTIGRPAARYARGHHTLVSRLHAALDTYVRSKSLGRLWVGIEIVLDQREHIILQPDITFIVDGRESIVRIASAVLPTWFSR